MICPQCADEGEKSTIQDLGGTVTLMGHTPYYDEEGIYHNHDPNTRTNTLRCSRGHQWNASSKKSCPAPGCTYGRES